MIERYTLPEMAAVFSDTARFGRSLEIELLATRQRAGPMRPSSTTRSSPPSPSVS